jgi:hypothetical protein
MLPIYSIFFGTRKFKKILYKLHRSDHTIYDSGLRQLKETNFSKPRNSRAFLKALKSQPLGHNVKAISIFINVLEGKENRTKIIPIIKKELGETGLNELCYWVTYSIGYDIEEKTSLIAVECLGELKNERYLLELLKNVSKSDILRKAVAKELADFDSNEVKVALKSFNCEFFHE